MSSGFSPVFLRSGRPAREAWPFASDVVPLNHGSFGAVTSDVSRVRRQLLDEAERSPVGWFPRTAAKVRDAREQVAGFVGAGADDTVFVPNASAAATVVHNALQLDAGDEVLVTDHGYGAVTMGAERLARRWRAVVRTVPVDLAADDDAVVAALAASMGPRTRLVVVDQITSATARALPTARITALAHEHGARVLVDGAHAPGLVPDAAAAAGGDWWFGNLHKWPTAPRGSALLVTSAADRDGLWPLVDSWNAGLPYPERFDMQGTLDVTPYLASPAAVEWIEAEYGWDRTRAAVQAIVESAAGTVADAIAPHVDGDPRPTVATPAPSMRLVRLPGTLGSTREEADGLRERLYDATRIESAFTSFRGVGYVRLSAHLYTTPDDVSRFVDRAVPLLVDWSRN